MKIVTAGSPYIDIDAYAGCVAYAELLRLQGHDAIALSTSRMNESITRALREWEVEFESEYAGGKDDTFLLVDVSDPAQLDSIVDMDRIEEVVDHRVGGDSYWREKIGDTGVCIELVGSACTLIYERWKRAGLVKKISKTSARLLMCGILDNTLNFRASITTDRDREAYDVLLKQADLPQDWPRVYFSDCESAIFNNFPTALQNDSKMLIFATFPKQLAVGQVVVWNGSHVISEYGEEIDGVLASMSPVWFLNIVSISEGCSYFYAHDPSVKSWLAALLGVEFDGSVALASRLWLRKEIFLQDFTRSVEGGN